MIDTIIKIRHKNCLYLVDKEDIIKEIKKYKIPPCILSPNTKIIDLMIICGCGLKYKYSIKNIPDDDIECRCKKNIIEYLRDDSSTEEYDGEN